MRNRFLRYSLTLIVLFALWETIATYHTAFSFLCPPPSKIIAQMPRCLPFLLHASLCTVKGILGGFFLALCLSLALSALMLSCTSAKDFLHPLFIFVQCTPMFTIAPLIVLWLGWGYAAVMIPTALTVFFPLTITIYQGITSTPEELLEQFALNQATPWQTFSKLRIPYALPHIFSGLKIAIGSAGFATIAGECLAAQNGLGILMLESRRNYDMEMTFSGLFALTLVTFLLFQIVVYVEKMLLLSFKIKKKERKRLLILLALTALLFFPLYPTPHTNQKGVSLTLLLDWTPNPSHIPLYVGVSKKFFQEQNIDLHIRKNTDTGSVIPHVLFEKVDLTIHHASGILKTAIQGAPLQIVGSLIDSSLQGFIYRTDSNITSIQDLHNKVLGFCLNNAHNLSYLLETLRLQGVVPSEVKNVSADLISPMVLKKIDFLYGGFYTIEGVKLRNLGVPVECFLSDTYHVPTGPQMLILGKKNTNATSPDVVHKIQTALHKSIHFCQTHPQEAFQVYLQATKHTPKIISDERAQWEATLPLLAQSQSAMTKPYMRTLLYDITQRFPHLTQQAHAFPLEELYPNQQVSQDERTHAPA